MFNGSIQEAAHNNRKSLRQRLSFLVLSVFALTIFVGKAHAQIVGDLEADIPFQFHVGNTELPAGDYRIQMLDDSNLTVMKITSADGSASALFQVHDFDAKSAPTRSELIFNKYGNDYFLSKLFDEGDPSGSELIESRAEKQISKGTALAEEHLPVRHGTQRGN